MYSASREEVPAADGKVSVREKENHNSISQYLKHPVFLVSMFLLLSTMVLLFVPQQRAVFAVALDGKQLALVSDGDLAWQVYEEVKADLTEGVTGNVVWVNKFTVQSVQVDAEQALATRDDLYEALKQKLTFNIMATAIEVNEETKVILQDKSSAERVLDLIKEQYKPGVEDAAVESVKFEEEVKLNSMAAEPEEIVTVEEAVNLLTTGSEVVQTHEVKEGDSLWTIARAYNLQVEYIVAANPGISEDTPLQPGQKLKLVKAEPVIHTLTTYQETVTEKVPYPVKVISDGSLWRGQEEVQEWGKYGEKEVQYRVTLRNGREVERKIIYEKVLTQPVAKIVRRGTKMMVASRGAGGDGELGWPLRGKITSGYGYRGREFHTGIDIDGKTGDPVLAAEDGKVLFAGWSGNYGYLVAIDHGDGLQTRYAHLSKIKVKVGQEVSSGDIIGLVGSTGRSTGSHLHFEVLVNEKSRNPLRYLE
ncbi:MAG: peptidoglycan DD-metalloendopeptidase family protein [Thermoanaerobacteraceae bacterium]|nr:peptidoglycan DD-metalloendopeptidase family protein [Thermoanaerobacteraceae bacterium]